MSAGEWRPAAVAAALERWYAEAARDLPWRRRRGDPYAVWVAEAMLQQTRVETVVGRYDAFLARFPDALTLAAADEDEVLRAWEGLGYYRRARQLHATARALATDYGGRLPEDVDALEALSGFGPYMAAAVASIAFGRAHAATDANAVRVFARLGRLEGSRGGAALAHAARRLHGEVVATARDPGALNQAVMDLGARVCRRRPRCEACPVRSLCAAHRAGGPALAARYPLAPAPRRRPERAVAVAAIVDPDGRVLARRRPPGLLGGLWGLPAAEAPAADAGAAEAEAGEAAHASARSALAASLASAWDAPAAPPATALAERGAFVWTFTHRRWQARVYRLDVAAAWPAGAAEWLDAGARAERAFGGPFRQALAYAFTDGAFADGALVSRRSASRAP